MWYFFIVTKYFRSRSAVDFDSVITIEYNRVQSAISWPRVGVETKAQLAWYRYDASEVAVL